MAQGIPLFLSMLMILLPLYSSLQFSTADTVRGSEVDIDEDGDVASDWQSDFTGGTEGVNVTLSVTLDQGCQDQVERFTNVPVDAACPYVEPMFAPSEKEDVVQFLLFRCNRYVPLRRCYEAIPDGVGLASELMPSEKSNWREFSRMFWPSQGLLDWQGMQSHVPGTVGVPNASHGWEWLASRKFGGNCGNCWSLPDQVAKKFEDESKYVKANLATVPFEDIRSMLDLGGGAGNIAAVLNKAYNTTVVSDNGDFEAPFLETIAARGLLSLSFSMLNRLPFVDGAFDAVHCRTTAVGDVEANLVENDRVVRPGGYIIMQGQCVMTEEGLHRLLDTASRLALRSKKWKMANTSGCPHLVSVVYQKPETRPEAPKRVAVAKSHDCATMECLCTERIAAWRLEADQVGTCPGDSEATWHWISQHCLLFGNVSVAVPSRCAAATKDPSLAARIDDNRSQRSARDSEIHGRQQFRALAQMGLPLSSDAVRTVLDINGDGRLVSELHAAHGIQGMVLSSDLPTLSEIASRGVVGLQSSLSVRQPFGNGAFDMIHVGSDCLDKAFHSGSGQQAKLERSLRLSLSGDLSVPAPPPNLHELVYEMDRLVRPGGYIVVSFVGQREGVPAILLSVVKKLGWNFLSINAKGVAFVRPSNRRDQRA